MVVSAFSQVITLPYSDLFATVSTPIPDSTISIPEFLHQPVLFSSLELFQSPQSCTSGVSISLFPYSYGQRHQSHHRCCIYLRTILSIQPQLLLSIVGSFSCQCSFEFSPCLNSNRNPKNRGSLWQRNSTLVQTKFSQYRDLFADHIFLCQPFSRPLPLELCILYFSFMCTNLLTYPTS